MLAPPASAVPGVTRQRKNNLTEQRANPNRRDDGCAKTTFEGGVSLEGQVETVFSEGGFFHLADDKYKLPDDFRTAKVASFTEAQQRRLSQQIQFFNEKKSQKSDDGHEVFCCGSPMKSLEEIKENQHRM